MYVSAASAVHPSVASAELGRLFFRVSGEFRTARIVPRACGLNSFAAIHRSLVLSVGDGWVVSCVMNGGVTSEPIFASPHAAESPANHHHRHHHHHHHQRWQRDKGRLDKKTGESMEELARMTKNFSGAEIEGLVKSAASYAFERGIDRTNLEKAPDPNDLVVQWKVCACVRI